MEGIYGKIVKKCNSGGGHSELTEGQKTGGQAGFCFVILNLFQNLIFGSLEVKRVRRYAVIKGQYIRKSSCQSDFNHVIAHLLRDLKFIKEKSRHKSAMTDCLSIHTLSLERVSKGQERIVKNSSLIPTHISSLISEGINLVSRFTFHTSLKQKTAFTLAEVLITLGIIGVVAAMTMPSLIANYQKKQTVAQLKKAYSVLSQAVERSVLDNGEIENWDWSNISNPDKFGDQYILPYLTGVDPNARYLGFRKGNRYWKSLDGTFDSSGSYSNSYPLYGLPDGMLFKFCGLNFVDNPVNKYKTHLRINIDVNGDRGPNKYGRDVFVFSLFPFANSSKGKLVPGTNEQCSGGEIHNDLSRDYLVSSGCATCKSDHTGSGYGCAAVIIKDGWEIKDDYPW